LNVVRLGAQRIRSVPRAVMAGVLAAVVLSGGVAVAAARIRTHPDLPTVAPSRLIADVIRAAEHGPAVSGTVSARIDLGLPSFPERGPAPTGLAALLAELSGEHRIRVWSSADGYRVDELLPTAERAIYVNRNGGWLWSSDDYTAMHLYDAGDLARLREAAPSATEAERSRLLHLFDPLTLVRQALSATSPSTSVVMGTPERVAGRPSYVMVLTPKDTTTLVGHVSVAIDAGTHVPLAVRVYAKNAAAPSLSASFVRVLYDSIPPNVYDFVPPEGSRVVDAYDERRAPSGSPAAHGRNGDGVDGVRVMGSGWSTIVALRLDAGALAGSGSPDGVDLRQLLPFSGQLFSVRLATVGGRSWLLAGAVPQRALAAAGAKLR
jgi:hypothetical protein